MKHQILVCLMLLTGSNAAAQTDYEDYKMAGPYDILNAYAATLQRFDGHDAAYWTIQHNIQNNQSGAPHRQDAPLFSVR